MCENSKPQHNIEWTDQLHFDSICEKFWILEELYLSKNKIQSKIKKKHINSVIQIKDYDAVVDVAERIAIISN